MKIFYDHLIFSLQKYGGVSKYFCELINCIPHEQWLAPILFSDNEYLNALKIIKQRQIFGLGNFRGRTRLHIELGKFYTIYKAMTKEFDIYHQTHFDNFLFPFIKNKKIVTTFHDTVFSQIPPKGSYWRNITQRQQVAIRRADKVIAISKNTKNDLLKFFSVDENKVTVIYHGINKTPLLLPSERIVDYPYILYVGTREKQKNWSNFVKAFSLLAKKELDIRLLCTGKTFSVSEKELLKDLDILDKTFAISASEKIMAQLYRDAEMFVFPSYYEGFGMPILEAMVYGCPVVLSNTSCFPEIAGEAGCYFDPLNIEDIAYKMKIMLSDKELKKRHIGLGKKLLENFSWEKCAQEHIDLYKSIL